MMTIDGACHCGRITYQAEIEPDRVTICHCIDCQRLSGSAFRVSLFAERERLTVVGEPKIYAKVADSGRRRLQHFCGDCGSALFSSSEGDDAGAWGIRWGGVRQRDQLRPARQIWRRSAPDWVCAFDDLPTHPQE